MLKFIFTRQGMIIKEADSMSLQLISMVKEYIINSPIFLGYIQRTTAQFGYRAANSSSAAQTETATEPDNNEPVKLENPYTRESRECILCKLNITPDYKNARLLSQFQSTYTGRIYGRHITGLCKNKQTEVEKAISRAQACGFMPIYHKAPEFLADPKLYDPEKPIRPHPH